MDYKKEALKLHEKLKGKLEVNSKIPLKTKEDLSLAYTPGVAEPCLKIAEDEENAYKYTSKGNMIAVVSDGSSVLGLGNIGPEASLPVMEGKAILFKEFADINAVPIVLDTQDVDEIVETVIRISPGFGGINLEDISAPRCFEIEKKLIEELNIPVFHDDQHGTAIVVLAGLTNALKLAKKDRNAKIVVNGSGAAGIAIARLLCRASYTNMIVCDSKGAIHRDRNDLSSFKTSMAKFTNRKNEKGNVHDVVKDADVFIGVSKGNLLTEKDIKNMSDKPIIMALANPTPEINPDIAKKAGAFIVATGRSDYPNQINNVLAFPGVFKGTLSARKRRITDRMKLAAADALANYVTDLTVDNIIPDALDKGVVDAIAESVVNIKSSIKVAVCKPIEN